jgi:PAS domain S-box-containing protein
MAEHLRRHKWAATPLGPIRLWPQSLRTAVSLMLAARQPVYIAWGPELTSLFNDAYIPILGDKHPGALGKPYAELFAEIWHEYRPIVEATMAGQAQHFVDRPVALAHRPGLPMSWFTFSWTPLRDEAGEVAGFYCAALETTEKVLAEKALRARSERELRRSEIERERQRRLYEAILTNTPDLAYVFDLDHRFVYVNEGLLRMWGLSWDEAIGKTCLELGYPDWHAALHDREIEQVIATGQPIRGEVPFTGAFGRRIYDYIFVPVLDAEGRVEAVAGTTRDVTDSRQAEEALRESEARWRGLFERMQEGVEVDELVYGADGRAVDFRYLEVNAAWERHTGLQRDAVVGRHASEIFPAEEVAFWVGAFGRVAETGEAAHIERYVGGPLGRWYEVIAYPFEPGRTASLVLDVTARKAEEERQALLAREVDHRAKNALAVVEAALRLTRAPDMPTFQQIALGRVSALARAQTLLAQDRWRGADLRALVEGELAPFVGEGSPRAELDGPPMMLPPGAAQPVAMALHELATNAVKYGALSTPGGSLSVSWRLDGGPRGVLRLRWAEAGGPAVAGPPARRGFGSRVLDATMRGQLGGKVSVAWERTGLVCEMEVPLGRALARAEETDPF